MFAELGNGDMLINFTAVLLDSTHLTSSFCILVYKLAVQVYDALPEVPTVRG